MDWVGMDANGRPVRAPAGTSWPVRAAAAVAGWPGLLVIPGVALVLWVLPSRMGLVWGPPVALLFTVLGVYQLVVLLVAVVTVRDPVGRREFYRQVRLVLVTVVEVVVLVVLVWFAVTEPGRAVIPGLWPALGVFAAGTAWDVRAAWREWLR